MLKRFVIAKSFGLHISKQEKILGNIFFDISKVRKSSRRGLLGGSNCILSQKSVPQGPFRRIKLSFELEKSSRRGLLGRQNCVLSQKSVPQERLEWTKLYFELEKRPARAFWAEGQIFKSASYLVLIADLESTQNSMKIHPTIVYFRPYPYK